MNINKTTLILLLAVLSFAGCKKVQPQAPANQHQGDTLLNAAALINMRMAEAADIQVTEWVKQADTTYTLEDYGYWYCIYRHTDQPAIQPNDHVELFYTSSTLSGQLIEDCQITIQVGRRETLWAIDNILPLMRQGEAVRMACPYYTAYGKDGNERVAPLQNCIVEITDVRIIDRIGTDKMIN